MARNQSNGSARLSGKPEQKSYDVGYGKPPKHSRFKPGQSGNPSGRPKGSRNKLPELNEERLKDIILLEAYRTITVNDGDRRVTLPMAQAIMRTLALNAAKGNQRALNLFTEMLSTTERENKRLHDEWLQTAISYKVDWEHELERRKITGETGPEPLPHPDDIVINMQTGLVEVKGPFTKEEKVVWDRWREMKEECDEEISHYQDLLEQNPDDPCKQVYLDEIAHHKRLRSIFCRLIPDE
jgi:hypothetical protein